MGSCGAVQERAGREQPERPHASESLARPYRRHEAERTVLYQIVSEHLETFLDEVHSHYDKPLPAYVEKELREFMKCGLLPYGFLRARCKRCGNELLVALSCKRRGVCCSCNARRMCATAAHLTDRLIPDVPLRQWVLSVPYELRLLLARSADALSAVGRIFVQEILRFQRQQAQTHRLAHTRGAAVLFPQRFGDSLNLIPRA
ncbi:MAG: transposase zinc-binding domain-containing protein [Polyangiaceae bacterium]|nr:transposase zinc-binding domain-containing protein [Polyangiaceae bacterium]